MEWLFWFKVFSTVLLIILASNFIITNVILEYMKDLTDVALNEQANITTVRKKNETALYRNFLVPSGFPLTTGLSLSLGYRIRNGNLMDVWKAIVEMSSGNNFVKFTNLDNMKYSIADINGMVKHINTKYLLSDEIREIGITVPCSNLEGFVITLASMVCSITKGSSMTVPHILSSIPRVRHELVDVLVIDSWQAFKMLNQSEKWYKLIIVCDTDDKILRPKEINSMENVVTWNDLIKGWKADTECEYTPPHDNSDDLKILLKITSNGNHTTSFNQLNLVSAISSFIKTFPLGHELTPNDIICAANNSSSVANFNLQLWPKLLSVLLYGGSANFVNESTLKSGKLDDSTLLIIQPSQLSGLYNTITENKKESIFRNLKLSFARALLSEGVFSKVSQLPVPGIKNLRAIHLREELGKENNILSFNGTVPKHEGKQLSEKFSTNMLNQFRALFGSRLIVELYCPYIIMGPISHKNFYDYRVLPSAVDSTVTCLGALTTSLEGKFIETEENENLDILKRQGMLCVRGFTIGKPVEEIRLKNAAKLCDDLAGGEGWMPIMGIFGLWGQDGCIYLYN